jgi:hypothetical protein
LNIRLKTLQKFSAQLDFILSTHCIIRGIWPS